MQCISTSQKKISDPFGSEKYITGTWSSTGWMAIRKKWHTTPELEQTGFAQQLQAEILVRNKTFNRLSHSSPLSKIYMEKKMSSSINPSQSVLWLVKSLGASPMGGGGFPVVRITCSRFSSESYGQASQDLSASPIRTARNLLFELFHLDPRPKERQRRPDQHQPDKITPATPTPARLSAHLGSSPIPLSPLLSKCSEQQYSDLPPRQPEWPRDLWPASPSPELPSLHRLCGCRACGPSEATRPPQV